MILGTAPMMLFGFISVAGIVQAQLATLPVIAARQTLDGLGKLRSPRLHTTCDREYLNRVGSQVLWLIWREMERRYGDKSGDACVFFN